MMIPASLLEAELDLEADEQRCLEERMTMGNNSYFWNDDDDDSGINHKLPRYADHVLVLLYAFWSNAWPNCSAWMTSNGR